MKLVCQNNARLRKLFLQLPQRLYGEQSPQNETTERQILEGTHPLSRDFKIYPFVVVMEERPVCRCILTVYPRDETGYVGFFEAEDHIEAVRFLLGAVERKAHELGKKLLVGPLDASIFIKYRFKLDAFRSVYTGEPINLPYYARLWEQCGFRIRERYSSPVLRKVKKSDFNAQYERIYQRYMRHGYRWVSPTIRTFPKALEDVYELLIELYAEFPGYKRIEKDQFMAMFGSLKWVLNFEMVRLVYKADRLQAFCICVPNYGKLTLGKMTMSKFFRFLNIRKHPEEYVITYVGASQTSPGLGCAMIQELRNRLFQNQCTAIGALIHEGKLTGKMYETIHEGKRTYGLYAKYLDEMT